MRCVDCTQGRRSSSCALIVTAKPAADTFEVNVVVKTIALEEYIVKRWKDNSRSNSEVMSASSEDTR